MSILIILFLLVIFMQISYTGNIYRYLRNSLPSYTGRRGQGSVPARLHLHQFCHARCPQKSEIRHFRKSLQKPAYGAILPMTFQELLLTQLHFPDSKRFGNMAYQHFFHYYPSELRLSTELICPNADCDLHLQSPIQFTSHGLPGYLFIYLYNAYLTLEHEETVVSCTAGQALFLPADLRWKFTVPAPNTHLYLCFVEGGCCHTLAEQLCTPSIHAYSLPAASSIPANIAYLLQHPVTQEASTQILFSRQFTEILTELYLAGVRPQTLGSRIPSYIQKTKELFDEKYAENYTLDDLEKLFDKSKYSICREFSCHYGISPLQYLNKRRIDEAKRLLLTTDMPIHEVGSHVGIENTNHFIQLFKKNTGATPFVFKQEAPIAICELHYPCTPAGHPQ